MRDAVLFALGLDQGELRASKRVGLALTGGQVLEVGSHQVRGNEQIPRVDFSQMVIVVSTWPGMAADSLHLGRCGKNENGVWVGA